MTTVMQQEFPHPVQGFLISGFSLQRWALCPWNPTHMLLFQALSLENHYRLYQLRITSDINFDRIYEWDPFSLTVDILSIFPFFNLFFFNIQGFINISTSFTISGTHSILIPNPEMYLNNSLVSIHSAVWLFYSYTTYRSNYTAYLQFNVHDCCQIILLLGSFACEWQLHFK